MTKNIRGLLEALRQSIHEAIMESHDVAAAMAALKRTGKYPVFSIDATLEEATGPDAKPVEALGNAEELILSDEDVEFLAAMGITDPSWSRTPSESSAR